MPFRLGIFYLEDPPLTKSYGGSLRSCVAYPKVTEKTQTDKN